ncbi:MAG: hypothetical protein BGO12_08010 [Verrucomicrobia bacterium 61-8]|nr:MAG: hypothetical protein BGO12_08010 [Verrucomicrobia bacterium 61-8]
MKRHFNIVGPQIRRLRNAVGWSQNQLAIKLQIVGMEHATRKKVCKIESREVWVSDDDLLFISRVLGADPKDLYPPKIFCARRLYEAICEAKASRYGFGFLALLSCPELGAWALQISGTVASV